jgi:hypothetical protein
MVSYYNIIDTLFLFIISYGIYYSYSHKSYVKIFEYFKIFIAITLSAKLSSYSAVYLQKFYIIKADTYTTLILITFVINLLIIIYGYKSVLKLTDRFINSEKIKVLLAKLFTVIEVVVLSTFALYIMMQIYLAKVYLYPTMKKTYLYPKIEKFYTKFLNYDFLMMVMDSDTGTNHKELLFKSLKNSL